MNRLVKCAVLATVLLLQFQVEPARSEWYLAGYGGYSAPQSLSDVTMDTYGERLAANRYGFSQTNVALGDTLTQNFMTSDLSLQNSPIVGGKGGYFFNQEGFSWLGVELEAFTTNPTIKTQTVNTEQGITFLLGPNQTPNPSCPLPAPTTQCSVQENVKSTLSINESSLHLYTVAFNVVARYPGKLFQPYAGVGAGAFYFIGSGQFDGRQVVPGLNTQAGLKILATEEWGLFVEGKYNYATITNLDPSGYGLSGTYNAFNVLAGVAYHF